MRGGPQGRGVVLGAGHRGGLGGLDADAGAAVVAAPDRGAVTRFARPTPGWGSVAPIAATVSGVNTAFGARMATRLF